MSKHNKGGLVKVQDPISGKCYFYDYIPTGRIKRMRSKYVGSFVDYLTKPTRQKYADAFPRCYATITRWNRH